MRSETGHPVLHQHEVAIRRMAKKHPEKVDQTDALLTALDQQAFDNLSTLTTKDGAVYPYTVMRLRFTPDQPLPEKKKFWPLRNNGKSQSEGQKDKPEKRERVIFGGLAVPDKGHPIYPEIFYNLPFIDMQDARDKAKPIEVTYLCIGQRTGLGGTTTKESNKQAKREQFKSETRQLVELAEDFLPKDQHERNETYVIFEGTSMGCIKAKEACFQLDHPDDKKAVNEINPPWITGLGKRFQPNLPQMVAGYIIEGFIKKRIPELKEEIIPSEYRQELNEYFEERGFQTQDTLGQRLGKERAVFLNIRSIFKNRLHEIDGEDYPFPVHIKTSALDPITFSFPGLKKAWQREKVQRGNVTVEFVMGTHTNNHYPVDNWAEAMDGVTFKTLDPRTNASLLELQTVQ